VGTPGRELREAMWTLKACREGKPHERIAQVLAIPLAEVPARIDAICAWALHHRILDPEAAPDHKGSKGMRRPTPRLFIPKLRRHP
jgi:hypothetical protein